MDESDLEAALRNYGIDVQSLDAGDPVEFAYLTAHPGLKADHSEMGRALNAFIDLAKEDEWEPNRVEATVLRSDDDVLDTWHADPEWFVDLNAYKISETEFSTRVLDTLDER
ncbi:MAG: hypothetical protein ABEJ82_06355 [Haloplanus sp.]